MNEGYRSVLTSIESSAPTPGGGAVAAMALGHGIALSRMVASLTVGRDKWAGGHESAEAYLSKSASWISEAIAMADADCAAFDAVMSAYRLPKESDEEKAIRSETIRSANIAAAESPLSIAAFCLEAITEIGILAEKGNANAITDAGSSSHMIHAAAHAAALNVKINLGSIGDAAGDFGNQIQLILKKVDLTHARNLRIVESRM